MKDEMDSLEVRAAVRELKDLEGGHVKKIYQPNEDEILLRIYVQGKSNKMLLFRVGKGLFLTEEDKDNPMKPGDYVMLMRKYTGNARIESVEQHGFDRVLTFQLQRNKRSRLIFEIFGKGNLILEGEKHILVPYRSESWSHRELKEGRKYKFPPERVEPFKLDLESFEEILEGSKKDLVRTLAVDLNLGGKYAEEVCYRLGVDKNLDRPEKLSEELYSELKTLRKQTEVDDLEPMIVRDSEGEIIDAVPFPLAQYEDHDTESMDSFNRALDLSFSREEEEEEKQEEAGRLERKLESQKRAVENLKEKEIENKVKAELIYQNYKRCENLLKEIKRARAEGSKEKIYSRLRKEEDVKQINDHDQYMVVELKGEVDDEDISENVKLDFRKDVNENAQHHYDKSKKSKEKIKGAEKAIEETKKEIAAGEEEKEREEKEPTVKFWFDRYKWFISSEGHIVVAGKDTKTNEEVVKKYLEKGDRYAHADAGGAPSVVIKKGEKDEIGKKTLEEACQYAVVHSKEWKRGVAAGRAYWVKPWQVSKTAEAGESLPTGAFVIRGKRNYMDDLPMEAVLAETEYRDKKKVMCAPSSALKDRQNEKGSSKKVMFIPGKKDINEFANEMSDYFRVPIDEIQKVIPPGDVNIVKKEG